MDIGCVKQLVLGFFSDFPTIFLHQKIAFWVELGSVKMRFFQHTCHLWLSPKKNISGHGIQVLSDCKLYKIILWMLAQWPKGMVRCETTCQLVKLLMNTYTPVDRGMHLLELVRVNILQKHQSSTNLWPIPNAFNHKQDRPGDILDNHILNPWMF